MTISDLLENALNLSKRIVTKVKNDPARRRQLVLEIVTELQAENFYGNVLSLFNRIVTKVKKELARRRQLELELATELEAEKAHDMGVENLASIEPDAAVIHDIVKMISLVLGYGGVFLC